MLVGECILEKCIRENLRGSALWDRLETSRGLSSVLRPAEAIFPRDFRETANPPAISQEVPYKPTTAQSESFRRIGRTRTTWSSFAEDSSVHEQFWTRVKYSYTDHQRTECPKPYVIEFADSLINLLSNFQRGSKLHINIIWLVSLNLI